MFSFTSKNDLQNMKYTPKTKIIFAKNYFSLESKRLGRLMEVYFCEKINAEQRNLIRFYNFFYDNLSTEQHKVFDFYINTICDNMKHLLCCPQINYHFFGGLAGAPMECTCYIYFNHYRHIKELMQYYIQCYNFRRIESIIKEK